MKKVGLVFGTLLAFFAVEKLVMLGIGPLLKPITKGMLGYFFVQLILELAMLFVFIVLNQKVVKQKILFEKYPLLKGFGLMWYTWLILVVLVMTELSGMKKASLSFSESALALVLALTIGCAEEFIFRGLILGKMVSSGSSVLVALYVSSVLFGAVHFINLLHNSFYNVGLQVLYAIPLGAFLGLLYLKSNALIYPIVAHGLQDFAAFFISGGKMDSTMATPQTVLQLYVVFGVIVVAYYLTGKKQLRLFKIRLENPVSTDSTLKRGLGK
ncbi:CPBP family intramembrane glutamic endopeptidase [Lactococcus hircilactis]|uniref:CPBP family intramembrane glutamic endopeptidase n=1 Tax=Lactococcus hircilactis TaxID=1494462 RepID=UPI003FA3086A